MGTGKTEVVVKYLKAYGKNKRVLWLTPRITLSANTQQRLAEDGIHFINYKTLSSKQKKDGQLDKEQYVICSIQSLHYLNTPFDIVIIDEMETVLNTFGGAANTHKDISVNWQAFCNIMDNSSKVICMDALTTKTTVNLVKNIIRKTATHIDAHLEIFKTNRPPSFRRLRLLTKPKGENVGNPFDKWLAMIFTAFREGKKLYIFTPFKKGDHGVDTIAQIFIKAFSWTEGEEVLAYYAEKEKEKRELCDANSIWGKESIFCIYSPFIPSRDFLQSLFRIRHPVSTDMIMYHHQYEPIGEKIRLHGIPKCEMYENLIKDLNIESILPLNVSDVVTENMAFLQNLQEDVECSFDFNRILDIDGETFEKHLELIYGNRSNFDIRLQVEKFRFKKKFKPSADNGALSIVWKKAPHVVDRVSELLTGDSYTHPKDLIVNRMLLENGVDMQSREFHLPENMVTSIPVSTIKKSYSLNGILKDYKSGLVSATLNAHFGLHLYKRKKKQIGVNKWTFTYRGCGEAPSYIQDCLDNLPENFKLECEDDADIVLPVDMVDDCMSDEDDCMSVDTEESLGSEEIQ